MDILIAILAVAFYSVAILLQSCMPRSKLPFIFVTGMPAILAHGYLLYHWIDVVGGQNLSAFNVFSLIAWLAAILTVLTALRRHAENLSLFVFPIAIISILLTACFPQSAIINTAAEPKLLIHIILGIFTFSILCIAGLQAILLAIQEHLLHHKQKSQLFQKLPPIEVMEKILFETIAIGFFLLSLVLTTSIYYFHTELLPVFLEKTLLVALAWLVFAILLIGRRFFGWRNQKAIYYTLGGVLLLIIGYFGSKLLEVLRWI